MGWLDSLGKKFGRTKSEVREWRIDHNADLNGLTFFWKADTAKKNIFETEPLLSCTEEERVRRSYIQILAEADVLDSDGRISYETVARFEADDLRSLGLEYSKEWKLEIRPSKPIGRGDPGLVCEWIAPNREFFRGLEDARYKAIPCGFFHHEREELHILPSDILDLRQRVQHVPVFTKMSEEYGFLSEIQKGVEEAFERLGNSQSVVVDEQLQRERYIVPKADEVKLEARNTADGGIEIRPIMPGFETFEAAKEVLNANTTQIWHGTDNLGRERIALDDVAERLKVAKVMNIVRPEEKDTFLSDPMAFAEDRLKKHPELGSIALEDLDAMGMGQTLEPFVEEYLDRIEGYGVPVPVIYDPVEPGTAPSLLEGVKPIQDMPERARDQKTPWSMPAVLLTKDNDEELRFAAEAAERLRQELHRFPISNHFEGTLHAHQEEGHIWLRTLWEAAQEKEAGQGGLLADEMGLGKTVQVAALLAYLAEHGLLKQTLIVVPGAVLQNWKNELNHFVNRRLRILIHQGPSRTKRPENLSAPDVIITTYETLGRDQLLFKNLSFNTLVVDEAHLIKNYNTVRARAVRAMKARLRIALSATPVENRLEELWAIIDFAQPGLLNSLRDYKQKYVVPIETNTEAQKAAKDLLTTLQPHYLRRTKDVLKNLPKKHVHVVELSMTPEQEEIYDLVRGGLRGIGARGLGIIHTLARTAAHPAATPVDVHPQTAEHVARLLRDPETLIKSSPKFSFIIDKLQEIREKGERAIIFTSAKIVQPLLVRAIEHVFGFVPKCITGDEKIGNRPRILDEFDITPGFNVIILSPQTVGLGVNLTGANHVFHLTREWNPSKEDQATARVYRIGQEREVHVYVPIVRHSRVLSVDERLNQLMEEKGRLTRSVIRPSGDLKIADEDFVVCLKDQPREEAILDTVILDYVEQKAAFELRQSKTLPLPAVPVANPQIAETLERILRKKAIEVRAEANELQIDEIRELLFTIKHGAKHTRQIASELGYIPSVVTALMASLKHVLHFDGFVVLSSENKAPRGTDTSGMGEGLWYSLNENGLKELEQHLNAQVSFEDCVESVFDQIRKHKRLSEDDLAKLMGSPRQVRRFSDKVEALARRAGLNIRVQNGDKKWYILE